MLDLRAWMARRLAGGLLLSVLALAPGGAAAQQARQLPPSVLPGIGAADPRKPVDASMPPWNALGRVQLETGGRCTGVLVAPHLVLTAAHCLVARRTGMLVRPSSVHVMLGYDRGAAAAHGRVTAYRTGTGFRPELPGPPSADWALLTLAAPLAATERTLPMLRGVPTRGTALMLGGYQQDRPEVLLADSACRALGLVRDEVGGLMLAHDCTGTRGASGAPLLVRHPDGGWGVIGIASLAAAEAARGLAVPAAIIPLPD